MILPGDEDRDALSLSPPADLRVHLKAPGNLSLKARLKPAVIDVRLEEELGTHEEPATTGIRGVLV